MKKVYSLGLITITTPILIGMFDSTACADQLWDQGRAYGTFLNGNNVSREMNVMSAQARGGGTGGVERVRVWARLDNVRQLYPMSSGYSSWINGVNIRLYSDDYRRNELFITGVNPSDVASSSTIAPVVYDILSYKGVPTNMISAYVNNFLVSGITTTGLGSYDVVRTFKGSQAGQISLPNSIPYHDADGKVAGKYSSAQSYFGYDIRTSNYANFNLWPQGRVQYGFSYMGSAPWYYWTNYAGVKHKVNRT